MVDSSISSAKAAVLHIICDRDVGLFALILSVIAHVHWAISERRIPIVYYCEKNCYWTPNGYRDRDTVWDEPVIPEYPASALSSHLRELMSVKCPVELEFGYFVDEFTFISNHTGALIQFEGGSVKDYGAGRCSFSFRTPRHI